MTELEGPKRQLTECQAREAKTAERNGMQAAFIGVAER